MIYNLIDDVKSMFKRKTPLQIVADELNEATMALLQAESGVEYANSLVAYNKARCNRLRSYLIEESKKA